MSSATFKNSRIVITNGMTTLKHYIGGINMNRVWVRESNSVNTSECGPCVIKLHSSFSQCSGTGYVFLFKSSPTNYFRLSLHYTEPFESIMADQQLRKLYFISVSWHESRLIQANVPTSLPCTFVSSRKNTICHLACSELRIDATKHLAVGNSPTDLWFALGE